MFNRTSRMAGIAAVALSLVAVQVATSTQIASAGRVSRGGSATIVCDGKTDTTAALQNAVNAGGTVTIPAGTCVLSNTIGVHNAVTIVGAGSAKTFLVQHASSNIFQISGDNVTVQGLNLDTATYNPGPAALKAPKPAVLYSYANNTHLSDVVGEAGAGFGMRFTGPNPCYTYQRGGTVLENVTMTAQGTGGLATVDIDCQNHATLTNVTVYGNYIAFYQDENVTLTGETYTPDAKQCQAPWYMTGPSQNIAISNVQSNGGAGIEKGANNNVVVTNQTIHPGC